MSAIQVAYHNDAWACYRVVNGRYRLFLGCGHRLPASAIAHAKTLESRAAPSEAQEPVALPEATVAAPVLRGVPLGQGAPASLPPSGQRAVAGRSGSAVETAANPGRSSNAPAGDLPPGPR